MTPFFELKSDNGDIESINASQIISVRSINNGNGCMIKMTNGDTYSMDEIAYSYVVAQLNDVEVIL